MALHARTAASVAALLAVLGSPFAAAAQPRAGDASPTRAHAAQSRARAQAPSGRPARSTRAADRAEGDAQPAWDPNAIVRWVDQDGTVHYTRGYEVPPRFRPKVRPVQATVGSVPVDPVADTKKSAASSETPVPAPPMATLPPGPVPPPAARPPQGEPSAASQDSTTGPRQPAP